MHLTDKTALAGVAPGYDEADNDAVNMAALTRALDVGQVDGALSAAVAVQNGPTENGEEPARSTTEDAAERCDSNAQ